MIEPTHQSPPSFQLLLNEQQQLLLTIFVEEIYARLLQKLEANSSDEKLFLKGNEMADKLGVSWSTFKKLKAQGLPTVILDSGMELYSVESVTQWILSHER
jgi:hypothetical protein